MDFIVGCILFVLILGMGSAMTFFHWIWDNLTGLAILLYIKSVAIFGCRFFDKCESPLHYLFTLVALGLDIFRDYFLAKSLNSMFVGLFDKGFLWGVLNLIASPIALGLIFFAGIFPMYAVYPGIFGAPSKKEIPYEYDKSIFPLTIGCEGISILLLFLLNR